MVRTMIVSVPRQPLLSGAASFESPRDTICSIVRNCRAQLVDKLRCERIRDFRCIDVMMHAHGVDAFSQNKIVTEFISSIIDMGGNHWKVIECQSVVSEEPIEHDVFIPKNIRLHSRPNDGVYIGLADDAREMRRSLLRLHALRRCSSRYR